MFRGFVIMFEQSLKVKTYTYLIQHNSECVFCGSKNTGMSLIERDYTEKVWAVRCLDCNSFGPMHRDKYVAESNWLNAAARCSVPSHIKEY